MEDIYNLPPIQQVISGFDFVGIFVYVCFLFLFSFFFFFFLIRRSIWKASSEYSRAVTLKVNGKTLDILTTSPIKRKESKQVNFPLGLQV